MKKFIVALLSVFIVTFIIVSPVLAADPPDTTVNIGVVTGGDVTANVDINSDSSTVNINGINQSQVNINGGNVEQNLNNTAWAVASSWSSNKFNTEDYKQWVKPTRDKVDVLETNLYAVNDNVNLAMDGLAKAIGIIQQNTDNLSAQREQINDIIKAINQSVLDREALSKDILDQYSYIDAQLQNSIDRDKNIISMLNAVESNLNIKINDNSQRIDSIVASNKATNDKINELSNEIEHAKRSYNDMVIVVRILFGILAIVIFIMAYNILSRKK